jgi:hypothetical protein
VWKSLGILDSSAALHGKASNFQLRYFFNYIKRNATPATGPGEFFFKKKQASLAYDWQHAYLSAYNPLRVAKKLPACQVFPNGVDESAPYIFLAVAWYLSLRRKRKKKEGNTWNRTRDVFHAAGGSWGL